MSCTSPRNIAPPPCLPLGTKDLLKEDMRLLDEERFLIKERLQKGCLTEEKVLEGDC
jgi:hypothetical protein